MEPPFWHARWQADEIGFHQREVNPYLVRHWPELGLPPGARVFVPLCGKSLDLAWLRGRGHPVVGIELSEIAVGAFFESQGLVAAPADGERLGCWQAPGYQLFVGDFFHLTAELLGPVDAVYDRAALIALPSAMRPDYVAQLDRLLPRGIPLLLVTVEYDQQVMKGPPFSVAEEEVMALFSSAFACERIARYDVLDANPQFRRRGLERLHETVYRLRTR